jgi:hypothetical protein
MLLNFSGLDDNEKTAGKLTLSLSFFASAFALIDRSEAIIMIYLYLHPCEKRAEERFSVPESG